MHFVFVIQTVYIMPKVKRGRRHHHAQPKNGERKHQNRRRELQDMTNKIRAPSEPTREQVDCSGHTLYDASYEQSPSQSDVVRTTAEVSTTLVTHCGERDQPNSEFENLKAEFSQSDVHNWHIFMNTDLIQLSYVSNTPPEPSTVSKVLNVYKNMEWKVFIYGNRVLSNSSIISDFPSVIHSYRDAKRLLEVLTESGICEGNNENDFIELLGSRGGEIKNHSTVTAYLDKVSNTVRHRDCSLICSGRSKCKVCQKYRNTLRALKSKSLTGSSKCSISTSSHANYRYLQNSELKQRLQNVQRVRKTTQRRVDRMKEKLNKLINNEAIEVTEDDSIELEELFSHTDEALKDHGHDHFYKVFWDQQRQYNKLSCKKKMKWHPLMIRFALNLQYLSSSAYNAVGNFLSLPTQRTLRDYTHFTSFQTGLSIPVINKFKEDMCLSSSSPSQRKVTILMDEMKVKSGLVFNKASNRLVGFVNLGEVNNDLEILRKNLSEERNSPKSAELAESMLVMMVRPIFKPSYTFPIAQYPTSSLSGEKLYPMMWDVVEVLELNDIQVHAISCDGLSANRKFFRISKDSDNEIPFKTKNPFDQSRSIYFFCDVPHLLKTTRNCFSNSFAHANSRFLKV